MAANNRNEPAQRSTSKPPKRTERPPKLAGALQEVTDILAALDEVQNSQTYKNGVRICTLLIDVIVKLIGHPRP